jgi:hypothetical protein
VELFDARHSHCVCLGPTRRRKVTTRRGDSVAVGDSRNPGEGSPSKPSSGCHRCWRVVTRDCARSACEQHNNQRIEGSGCIGMQVNVISRLLPLQDEAAPRARRAVLSQSCTQARTRHVVRLLILCSWRFIPLLVCLAVGASHSRLACQTVLVMFCP